MIERKRWIYSAIKTPDGTILESRHRHDYVTHEDSLTGETYVLDGGTEYFRSSINNVAATNLSVFLEDGHDKVRDVLKWGTRGKNGDQPIRYVTVSKMTTDHIESCLLTQNAMHPYYVVAFVNELKMRDKNYTLDFDVIESNIHRMENSELSDPKNVAELIYWENIKTILEKNRDADYIDS